jgi:preprotein translocase subunit SecE
VAEFKVLGFFINIAADEKRSSTATTQLVERATGRRYRMIKEQLIKYSFIVLKILIGIVFTIECIYCIETYLFSKWHFLSYHDWEILVTIHSNSFTLLVLLMIPLYLFTDKELDIIFKIILLVTIFMLVFYYSPLAY